MAADGGAYGAAGSGDEDAVRGRGFSIHGLAGGMYWILRRTEGDLGLHYDNFGMLACCGLSKIVCLLD